MDNYNEILKWRKREVYVRIILITMLILLGVLVWINGLSPCEKCKVRIEAWDREYSCLEILYNWSLKCFPPTQSQTSINFPTIMDMNLTVINTTAS